MIVIIMAGGLGKRMNSPLPKVLHKVQGIPMLVRIIHQAIMTKPEKILVIVGKYRQIIEETLKEYMINDTVFIDQPETLGTGHAIMCCKDYLESNLIKGEILILSGDTPLLTAETMKNILSYKSNTIMTTLLGNPSGNGRIIRSVEGKFEKIVEEKDCNEFEKKIFEVNCGIYVFDCETLLKYIMMIDNKNAQNEYYLTDVIKIINDNEKNIKIFKLDTSKQYELTNVNTIDQLHYVNSIGNFSI